MKAVKLSAIAAAALLSTGAMANVVTDAGNAVVKGAKTAGTAVVDGVKNTGGAVVDGGKTLFKTAVNPAAVSLEVGSLGYGANVAWSVNPTTELQAGWAGGDVTDLFGVDDLKIGDYKYDVRESDFSNPYLGVQMRPASNWLTVGAGVIVPDWEIKATPVENRKTGEKTGLTAKDVEATIENGNDLAPYLTVGFRPNLNKNWGVFGEVGAAYMGKPDVTFTTNEANVSTATQSKIRADIRNEDLLRWFPIAKVGVTYRF
ncbi:hypothetical protein B0181_08925 [Moraxella caviae]|uniref:Outer membrane protein W n=1 Tax=Moraxella caviae TaxID=34060 RepID=A0A1S9ZWZ7_9GAMM|nr:hypothetical protein [Moraxella caviae]OOR88066.1 hypothetical protein B0181_08925 [Moraxella caviae]STZ09994.1 Uncharacterised protein [Moraxella caviae]VEW12955.1 Uncharacterised protein [Moraxella caviae]